MKKDQLLHRVLRNLAVFCSVFFVWPVLVWVNSALFGRFTLLDAVKLLGAAAVIVAAVLALGSWLGKTKIKQKLAAVLCYGAGTALSLALAILLFMGHVPAILANFAIFFVAMVTACRSLGRDYKLIADKWSFVLASVTAIAPYMVMAAVNFIKVTTSPVTLAFNYLYLTVGYLLFIGAYVFLLNEGNIDRTMERRHYKLSLLPSRVRINNSIYLLIIFSLLVLAFIFKGPIVAAVMYLVGLVGRAAFYIVFGGIMFLQNRNPDLGDNAGSMAGGSSSSAPDLGQNYKGNGNIDVVFFIILAIVLAFFWKPIFAALGKFFRGIWRAFKALWLKIFKFSPGDLLKLRARHNVGEFEDSIENVAGEAAKRPLVSKRRLKRQLAELQKSGDPAERLKGAYAVYLTVLANLGFDRKPSHTPEEIAGHAEKLLKDGATVEPLTTAYEKVKYGGQTVGEDFCEKIIADINLMTKQTKPAKAKP